MGDTSGENGVCCMSVAQQSRIKATKAKMHDAMRIRSYPAAVSVAIHLHHGHLASRRSPLSPRSRGTSSATSPVKRRRRHTELRLRHRQAWWWFGRLHQSPPLSTQLCCCTVLLGHLRPRRQDEWIDGDEHAPNSTSAYVRRVLLFIVRRQVTR